jgi:hypothetical protein
MKKILFLICFVVLLAVASSTVFATLPTPKPTTVNIDWRGPAYPTPGTQDWFTASANNWGGGSVGSVPFIDPNWATNGKFGMRTYGSTNYDTSLTTCPIIANGDAVALEVRVGGTGGNTDTAYLIMNSGTLKTEYFMMIGPDSGTGGGRSGTVYMHGGTITLGGVIEYPAGSGLYDRSAGALDIGFGTGTYSAITGRLYMDGGTIDCGSRIDIGDNYAKGEAFLSGSALITATELIMRPNVNNPNPPKLDLQGNARIILNGDWTSRIQGYKDNGWINEGVQYDYNISNLGRTTLYIPEPATICLLGIGLFGLIRRK